MKTGKIQLENLGSIFWPVMKTDLILRIDEDDIHLPMFIMSGTGRNYTKAYISPQQTLAKNYQEKLSSVKRPV